MRKNLGSWLAVLLGLAVVSQAAAALAAGAWELQEDFVRAAEQVSPAVVSLKCLRVVPVAPFPTLEEEFFPGGRLLKASFGNCGLRLISAKWGKAPELSSTAGV